jgi:transitional endoplasmic reticulum ATPase
MTGYMETSYSMKRGRLVFQLSGTIIRKHKDVFTEIGESVKRKVLEESIYRNKALKIKFKDDNGKVIPFPEVEFLILNDVIEKELVFNKDLTRSINANLFVPIEHSAECRKAKIPLKRGILLAGEYGTGKTMLAFAAAAKAVRNNWTFLYLEHGSDIAEGIKFAENYQPCVIFCEDVDRVTDSTRDVKMDELLNTLDGIESKKVEVIVILTTNNVQTQKLQSGLCASMRVVLSTRTKT